MNDRCCRIGITLGDVNGIGTEVTIKALSDSRMCDDATYIIYGGSGIIEFYMKTMEDCGEFAFKKIADASQAHPHAVNLIECPGGDTVPQPGEQTPASGAAAVSFLRRAADDLEAGLTDVLVTAPINKAAVQGEDFSFTGHTEFLASRFGGEPLMLMCSDSVRIGLQTIHVPLEHVSEGIDKSGIVTSLERLRSTAIRDFAVHEPRIAVLSLNPHAGDGGLLGDEENGVIRPAIAEAYASGILAFGPFAADGFFASGRFSQYDAILAMYHDQGLIPFKTLCPDGVNFTANLGIIRTSPDHGVGYDIAGKDMADGSSMRQAIYRAMDIRRNRAMWDEATRNPLRHFERERGRDVSVRDLPDTEQN